ncbi:MAG: phosphopantetheine-binding protein [Steroidobacteraceae bacterium]
MTVVSKESVLILIKQHLPFGSDLQEEIGGNTLLAELGLDSLHLITLLLTLQREYSIDMASLTQDGTPETVSDLVALVERCAG